jgi:hypothetical protein
MDAGYPSTGRRGVLAPLSAARSRMATLPGRRRDSAARRRTRLTLRGSLAGASDDARFIAGRGFVVRSRDWAAPPAHRCDEGKNLSMTIANTHRDPTRPGRAVLATLKQGDAAALVALFLYDVPQSLKARPKMLTQMEDMNKKLTRQSERAHTTPSGKASQGIRRCTRLAFRGPVRVLRDGTRCIVGRGTPSPAAARAARVPSRPHIQETTS